jgi:hypothetical protein
MHQRFCSGCGTEKSIAFGSDEEAAAAAAPAEELDSVAVAIVWSVGLRTGGNGLGRKGVRAQKVTRLMEAPKDGNGGQCVRRTNQPVGDGGDEWTAPRRLRVAGAPI